MKRKIGYVLFAATVGALVALAGPLNPPSGPVSSTGVSLPEIKQAVEAVQTSLGPGQLPSNVGYEVAGLPPDTLTTSLQTLVSGRQGVIKRIVIGSEFFPTTQGVELWVDGKFAGVYRGPTAATSASGIVEFAVFDVNIKFGSTVQAKVRLQQSSDKLSVAVHFLPTPPYVGYEVAGQPPDTLTTWLRVLSHYPRC